MNTFSLFEAVTFGKLYGWVSFGFSAVAVLAVLIVAHEFGHFIVGRMLGARVDKFSIGFGKKIISSKRGNTEYILAWIPLGGYVKFYGDDPDVEVEDKSGSFYHLSVWRRLMIVAAGPIFNVVLAIFIASVAAWMGLPEGTTIIEEVKKDTPAMTAGLQPGDKVDAINGVVMKSWGEVVDTIRKAPGARTEMEITRENGELKTITITPNEVKVKTMDGKEIVIGQIGVTPRHVVKSYPPHQAIVKGAQWTWNIVSLTMWGLSKLVTRQISADQIAGPIGIMQMAGAAADSGLVNLLLFIALISVNVGILNLLPIPILDGGHIVFFSLEALLGRPVEIKTQEIAQKVGVFLLISLMALAFYNDIARLLSG